MAKKIGILGSNGFVGKILRRWFEEQEYEVKGYDIQGKCDPEHEVLKCPYIFISINFQDNALGEVNQSLLDSYCNKMNNGTVVVIKSTFVPGSLDRLQNKFPNLIFVYNPEFLTELTAWEDFSNPEFQILGMPHQALGHKTEEGALWEILFKMLPDAPVKEIISPKDAEVLKHAFNSYFALKVTWFNQLFDACLQLDADYDTVRRLMVKHEWVGDSHSIVWHKGYRGYGGKCLIKDPLALSKVASFPIINHMEEYNANLNRH